MAPEDESRSITEFSFNSDRKRMTIIGHRPEGLVAFVKGAPEVILECSTRILVGSTERDITEADIDSFTKAYVSMAESGLRTLAVARRILPESISFDEDSVEKELTLLGVVGIIDPPRPEVPRAISLALSAGIRPIMITGDAAATAMAIARNVGMNVDRAITGRELDTLDEDELHRALMGHVLFARTTPAHKLRIVTLL